MWHPKAPPFGHHNMALLEDIYIYTVRSKRPYYSILTSMWSALGLVSPGVRQMGTGLVSRTSSDIVEISSGHKYQLVSAPADPLQTGTCK